MKRQRNAVALTDPARFAPMLAIRNAREYDRAVAHLNELVDGVGDHPKDPRYRFIDTLSLLIEAYDREHHQIPDASPEEMLKFLMEQHDLTQRDLPEVGSQGVVSEILRSKRALNVRQIRALARRFGLPVDAFFPEIDRKRAAV